MYSDTMQVEGKRICSVHPRDHETGAVSALELVSYC